MNTDSMKAARAKHREAKKVLREKRRHYRSLERDLVKLERLPEVTVVQWVDASEKAAYASVIVASAERRLHRSLIELRSLKRSGASRA